MDLTRKQICPSQPWRQLALCLMVLATGTVAFQPQSRLQQQTTRATNTARHFAVPDPNDLANLASAMQHHPDVPALDAMLSTMYSTTVDGILKPAHGHSQPLFGPADPWLTSGHSIAPNLKGLDMGTPAPVDKLPEVAQAAIDKGWKVVDASKFQAGGGSILPGFKATGGILPGHANVPDGGMAGVQAQVLSSAKFIRALEKLPMAAFVYVLIDFFVLRPDVDVYKEDIEEEPLEVAAETLAVSGIRLGVFFLIGMVTVVLFG